MHDERRKDISLPHKAIMRTAPPTIDEIARAGIFYLDQQTEFLRQQEPIYARKASKKKQRTTQVPINAYVKQEMKKISKDQTKGRYLESLAAALKLKSLVEGTQSIKNKYETVAQLYTYIGNAHLEFGEFKKALVSYLKDYELGQQHNMESAQSRALNNLGIAYIRMKDYEMAVASWLKSLELPKTTEEEAWLYHEIGRSCYEMGDYKQAKECGEKCLTVATQAEENTWILNATLLIAQCQVKTGKIEDSIRLFEQAQQLAKYQNDKETESVIEQTLAEVVNKIDTGTIREGLSKESIRSKKEYERSLKDQSQESVNDVSSMDVKHDSQMIMNKNSNTSIKNESEINLDKELAESEFGNDSIKAPSESETIYGTEEQETTSQDQP